jgi:hypothetical protein
VLYKNTRSSCSLPLLSFISIFAYLFAIYSRAYCNKDKTPRLPDYEGRFESRREKTMYQNIDIDLQSVELTRASVAQPLAGLVATKMVPANQPTGKPPASISVIRHYLTHLSPETLDAQAFTDELAMRAKIIAEYMQQHAITDINRGIRAFTAFERERLQRLGLLVALRPRTCNLKLTNSRN